MHRATKECELPESANRSIARRAHSYCVRTTQRPPRRLDKQCLLIEGAAERSGYQLDDEDKQALRSMDWSGSDEELNQRVSKGYMRWC